MEHKEGEQRHIQLAHFLANGCTELTRGLVEKIVELSKPAEQVDKPWSLDHFLYENLEILSKSNIKQRNILFPGYEEKSDIVKWDLSLLCLVIKKCSPCDIIRQDIHQLNRIRNKIYHAGNTDFPREDFDRYVEILDCVVERCCEFIDKPNFSEKMMALLADFKKGNVIVSDKDYEVIRQWYESDPVALLLSKVDRLSDDDRLIISKLDELHVLTKENGLKGIVLPDTNVELIVKNCDRAKEKVISEQLIRLVNCRIAKDVPDVPEADKQKFFDAVREAMTELLTGGRELVDIKQACVNFTIRCPTYESLRNLWIDCMTGRLTEVFKPLETYARQLTGCPDLTIDVGITQFEFYRCFEATVMQIAKAIRSEHDDVFGEHTNLFPEIASASVDDIYTDSSRHSPDEDAVNQAERVGTRVVIRLQPTSFNQAEHMWEACQSGRFNDKLEKLLQVFKEAYGYSGLTITAKTESTSPYEELRRLSNAGEDTCISMKIIDNRQSGSCPSDRHVSQVMSGESSIVEHVMSDSQEPEAMNEGIPPPIPKRFDSLTESAYNTCDQSISSGNEDATQANKASIWEGDSSSSEDDADDTNDGSSFLPSDFEDSSGEEGSASSTLKLRDYQLELAENAQAGHNTVIVAGTGSGKTWVALHIVKEHLSQAHQGTRKVVFMARTSALIKQQADRFKRYLCDYQTKLVTGENDESSNLGIFTNCNDILCFTPQILVNNLDNGSIKSLSEFSLLILDECHHTVGDEPYSMLMRKYLIEKAVHKQRALPQVVGLTASVGVGKSNTDEDAVDYLLKLFARLDVLQVSTVQRCKQQYEKISYNPTEKLIPMIVPDTDPCKEILLEAIDDTEERLQEFTLLNPAMIDTVVVNCPPEKESQAYAKWTVEVEKMAINSISDDETLRNVRTCAVYLNVYNAAIEVNSLLGPSDVIRFLAKKHELDNTSQDRLTREEKDLLMKLKGVQKKLSKHVKNENPNVRKLSDNLKKMMHKNVDESRAMVFVKARATCVALASFLKKDFSETGVKVHELYGKENRGGIDGMTESVQNDTVEKFRKGVYKVLVATSVGVEGIDVPDCNIVLNYNFQGNEITKIQMKGRSRKKDGVHVIMGDKKQLETEEINAYKLAMMQRALKRFIDMDPKESSRKISLYQKEEMQKYKMKKMIEEDKRNRKSTEGDFEIRCRRCNSFACYTSDIRMVKCQYIVIDNLFAEKINMKPHTRPRMYDGFYKKFKMSCKKCPQDWGIVSDNKGLLCRTLKLESFKLRNMQNRSIQQYSKWEDVPVVIREIDVDDLARLLGEVQ